MWQSPSIQSLNFSPPPLLKGNQFFLVDHSSQSTPWRWYNVSNLRQYWAELLSEWTLVQAKGIVIINNQSQRKYLLNGKCNFWIILWLHFYSILAKNYYTKTIEYGSKYESINQRKDLVILVNLLVAVPWCLEKNYERMSTWHQQFDAAPQPKETWTREGLAINHRRPVGR